MSRLTVPTRESVPAASKPLLDAVEKQLGVVPNLFRFNMLTNFVNNVAETEIDFPVVRAQAA